MWAVQQIGSPNCLDMAMETAEVLLVMHMITHCSGVSVMWATRGVKQCFKFLSGSLIIQPTSAAFLRGFTTNEMTWWSNQSTSTLHRWAFRWINFGTGSKARRRYDFVDPFLQTSADILAKLIRRGWAWQFPTWVMWVLSDERTMPRRVTLSDRVS